MKWAVSEQIITPSHREVTIGQTRDTVEKELGLEPGTLKSAEYKGPVKEMIAIATVCGPSALILT